MDQYLLIPFLVGWTSIYQLFWCSPGVQGFDTLPCQVLKSTLSSCHPSGSLVLPQCPFWATEPWDMILMSVWWLIYIYILCIYIICIYIIIDIYIYSRLIYSRLISLQLSNHIVLQRWSGRWPTYFPRTGWTNRGRRDTTDDRWFKEDQHAAGTSSRMRDHWEPREDCLMSWFPLNWNNDKIW